MNSNTVIERYIRQLRDVTNGDLWIDETFEKKLAHVTERNAFIRPLPAMHSVGEVISHLLEWRLSTLNVLRGGAKTLTMTDSRNWRTNEELSSIGWQSLLAAFHKSHEELVDLLASKDDRFLAAPAGVMNRDMGYYVEGMVHHDMYHLGQIGLILKLMPVV